MLVSAVAGVPTANIHSAARLCKGSGIPVAYVDIRCVPNVSCDAVKPAVADVLTAVAAVPTAVDFLLLRVFPTSLASLLLLAALCVSEEDLRIPNIRERNGKKSGSQKTGGEKE